MLLLPLLMIIFVVLVTSVLFAAAYVAVKASTGNVDLIAFDFLNS